MAERCPNCSRDNPDGSAFCMTCGKPLTPETSSSSTFSPPSPPENASLVSGPVSSPVSQVLPETSSRSTFSPPAPPENASLASRPVSSPVSQVLQTSSRQSSTKPTHKILQMGTLSAGFNEGQTVIAHAFAGHGVPIMHHSWLLEGNAPSANEMFSTVVDILRQRNVQGLRLSTKKLREGGFQIEERYYLIVRRGVTTVFTYIAPAGRDLYISRATCVLLSLSVFRVAVLILLLSIALFAPSILVGMFTSSTSFSSGYLILSFLAPIASILSIPIWIYLVWYLILSVIYWVRERDFWVYLRSRSLNNFQLDDIMHLEHATDETVLAAAKQLGLDASKIVPPVQGYRPERRVRVL